MSVSPIIRNTENYVYCEANQLGSGATAVVYAGTDKRTGEVVAIKVFKESLQVSPASLLKRRQEFELLKKVDHENIVRIITIEKEIGTGRDVLVMELCKGESLFELMKRPIHANGFDDEDVLLILKQMTAAVRHMREKMIIHRDLKPGNIVRHIGDNGVKIFKVADFGTARELEDDQEFVTLCGTEAYLHPNLYAKAFAHAILRPRKKPCVASVDLWSIGVTLYHIITGSLPFRTHKPKDYATMYRIISEKDSNVISGIQTENGDIKWRTDLPETCLLSPDLRKLITPLIANLLESDDDKILSFDDYFKAVDNILSHKPFHLFSVNKAQDSLIYVRKTATLNELKQAIEEQTKIPSERQLLIWNGSDDFKLGEVNTTESSQILIVDVSSKEVKANVADVIKRCPAYYPGFSEPVSHWLHHYYFAKQWTLDAYSIRRSIDKCNEQTKMIHSTADNITKLLETKVRIAMKNQHSCCVIFNLWKQMFDYIKEINDFVLGVYHSTSDAAKLNGINVSKAGSNLAKLTIQMGDIEKAITMLNEKMKGLKTSWKINVGNNFATATIESNTYCEQLCVLLKVIELHVYSSNNLDVVKLEKLKFQNKFEKLFKLLHETCLPNKHKATCELEDWFPNAMIAFENCKWVTQKMNDFTRDVVDLQRCFSVIKEEQKNLLKAAKEAIDKQNGRKSAADTTLKQLLDSCLTSHERLSAQIQESQTLAAEFNLLTT